MKILITFLLLNLNCYAAKLNINNKINFVASGKPAFIKALGTIPFKSDNLIIDNTSISGNLIIDLTKLDSGIDLRDEHLKNNYLNTKDFPAAILKINKQTLNFQSSEAQDISTKLVYHNSEKDFTISGVKIIDGYLLVNTSVDFLLKDFDIKLPSYQGITAANKVRIKINFKAKL